MHLVAAHLGTAGDLGAGDLGQPLVAAEHGLDVEQPKSRRLSGRARDNRLVHVTVPDDPTALAAVRAARRLNATIPIMARFHFISNGMEAHRIGANEVIIEEKVVAQEFLRMIESNSSLLSATPVPQANH